MTNSPDNAIPVPTRPRRPHKKSRRGCLVCKRRHTKCDETRPTCLNCTISGRQCSYALSSSPTLPPTAVDQFQALTPASSVSDPPSLPSQPAEIVIEGREAITTKPEDEHVFNLDQMALFHHAQLNVSSVMPIDPAMGAALGSIPELALKSPYLMNQLLALTALHLLRDDPDRSEYRHQAANLQARAISCFNRAKDMVTEETCLPMFLFSSLLGLHVLHDTLRNRPPNFSVFLDGFVSYLHIHRGVAAVTRQSWDVIIKSRLKPIVDEVQDAIDNSDDTAKEVDVLLDMINQEDLTQSSIEIFLDTIKALRESLAMCDRSRAGSSRPEGPLAFCVKLNDGYIKYLEQRRPEALVLLAFYGVMLHWCRDFWIFGDGGRYLIESISSHLGTHWAQWLTWPNSVLMD